MEIITVEFFDTGISACAALQSYLDGINMWKLPINRSSIIDIMYSISDSSMKDTSNGRSGILLIHTVPV